MRAGLGHVAGILCAAALLACGSGESARSIPTAAAELYQRLLALDDHHPEALWFLGLAAAQAVRPDDAADLWNRLLAMLPPGSDEHQMLTDRIAALPSSD